jgi:xylulokinase
MEGIALELRLAMEALREAGAPIERCKVAGGGSHSAWWMQLKADLLGIPVEVPRREEPGTFGAALLAGIGLGTYGSFTEAAKRVPMARRFEPDPVRAASIESKADRHADAVRLLAAGGLAAPPSGEGT